MRSSRDLLLRGEGLASEIAFHLKMLDSLLFLGLRTLPPGSFVRSAFFEAGFVLTHHSHLMQEAELHGSEAARVSANSSSTASRRATSCLEFSCETFLASSRLFGRCLSLGRSLLFGGLERRRGVGQCLCEFLPLGHFPHELGVEFRLTLRRSSARLAAPRWPAVHTRERVRAFGCRRANFQRSLLLARRAFRCVSECRLSVGKALLEFLPGRSGRGHCVIQPTESSEHRRLAGRLQYRDSSCRAAPATNSSPRLLYGLHAFYRFAISHGCRASSAGWDIPSN